MSHHQRSKTPNKLARYHAAHNFNILSVNFYGFNNYSLLTIGEKHDDFYDKFKIYPLQRCDYVASTLETFLFGFQRFSFDFKINILLLFENSTIWPSPDFKAHHTSCSLLDLIGENCERSPYFNCLNIDSRYFCMLEQLIKHKDGELESIFFNYLPNKEGIIQQLNKSHGSLIHNIKNHYNLNTQSAIFKTFKYLILVFASSRVGDFKRVIDSCLDEVTNIYGSQLNDSKVNSNEKLKLFVYLVIIDSAQHLYEWAMSPLFIVTHHVIEYLKLAIPSLDITDEFIKKLLAIEEKLKSNFPPSWVKSVHAPYIQLKYKEMRMDILNELKNPNPKLESIGYKYMFEFTNIIHIRTGLTANLHALEVTFCAIWLLTRKTTNIICVTGAAHTRRLNSIIHYLPHDSPEMCASMCSFDSDNLDSNDKTKTYTTLLSIKTKFFESLVGKNKPLAKYTY